MDCGPLAITIQRAAQLLSLAEGTVYKMVRSGALDSVTTPGGGKVLVSTWSLMRYLKIPEEVARQVVSESLRQALSSDRPSSELTGAPAGRGPSPSPPSGQGGKRRSLEGRGSTGLEHRQRSRPGATNPSTSPDGTGPSVAYDMKQFDETSRRVREEAGHG